MTTPAETELLEQQRWRATLDALPLGAVIMDRHDFPWQKAGASHEEFPTPLEVWLSFGSTDLHSTAKILHHGPFTAPMDKTARVRKVISGTMCGFTAEEVGQP